MRRRCGIVRWSRGRRGEGRTQGGEGKERLTGRRRDQVRREGVKRRDALINPYLFLLLLLLLLLLLSLLLLFPILLADESFLKVFPKTWSPVAVYYIWGLFFFSLLAALYGAVYGIYPFYSSPSLYSSLLRF